MFPQVFEECYSCPFVFLHFCWDMLKKKNATRFSIMYSFGSYFQAMLLNLSQQMLKNVATPQFLDDFHFCPFSCLHFAETSCKKRNGYTFVWSNNKDNIEKMSAIYGFHDRHW
jgi:hypothetical protein